MSTTSEQISVNTIYADSGNISAINSQSINNADAISTGSLTSTHSVQVGGNLTVGANAIFDGSVTINGAISFGRAAMMSDNHDITIEGSMFVSGDACFSYDTVIGSDTFDDHEEGIVRATNIRAGSRLFVGDSSFRINAAERKIDADTYTQRLSTILADVAKIANAEIELLKAEKGVFKGIETVGMAVEKLYAKSLSADSFIATSEFGTKNLTVNGSEVISGGLIVNGGDREEGALVVNNASAIFNKGVKIYSDDGTMTQTLLVIGTTDTTGDATAETEAGNFALRTALGVRSLFMGDVVVQDSHMIFDNTPVLAENIIVSDVSSTATTGETLQIVKSGNGWDTYLDEQISYDSTTGRGAKAKKQTASDVLKSRSTHRLEAIRSFSIKNNATFRIDAGGNILAKNIVSETVRGSSIQAHDIVASDLTVDNLEMTNLSVPGAVSSDSLTVSGTTEFNGQVNNNSTITNKGASSVEFDGGSRETFNSGSTLKVEAGASLVTSTGSDVYLSGDVAIDMAKLVLFDSRTGKRYKFVLRDAGDGEADNAGETVIEYGEITEEETPAGSTGLSARNRRKLDSDLQEFQAKLKRI